MRVALVHYEFPIDTPFGGIGTYAEQLAGMLSGAGHDIRVFAGSPHRSGVVQEHPYVVDLVETSERHFPETVLPAFRTEHTRNPFDAVVGPEYNAETLEIQKEFPNLASVIKLHTPMALVFESEHSERTVTQQVNDSWTWLTNRRIPKLKHPMSAEKPGIYVRDLERREKESALRANVVTSPSASLGKRLRKRWGLTTDLIIPNAFEPPAQLLAIDAGRPGERVTYVGALTKMKGVFDIAAALRELWRNGHEVPSRFVGGLSGDNDAETEAIREIREVLGPAAANADFPGHVTAEEVGKYLEDALCTVVASSWENLPYALIEAMAAGRAVVWARSGGIPEIADPASVRLSFKPKSQRQLTERLTHLVTAGPDEAARLGLSGRRHILDVLSPARILRLEESALRQAIGQQS